MTSTIRMAIARSLARSERRTAARSRAPARSTSAPSWTSAVAAARSGPGLAVGAERPDRRADARVGLRDTGARRGRAARRTSRSRRSSAWAAHSSSMRHDPLDVLQDLPGVARRDRRPSTRGPPGSRDVGIESADAGCARTLFSDARAAAVYWTIISPEFRPGSGARNAGSPPFSRGSTQQRRPPLARSTRAPRARASRSRARGRSARRGSCRR